MSSSALPSCPTRFYIFLCFPAHCRALRENEFAAARGRAPHRRERDINDDHRGDEEQLHARFARHEPGARDDEVAGNDHGAPEVNVRLPPAQHELEHLAEPQRHVHLRRHDCGPRRDCEEPEAIANHAENHRTDCAFVIIGIADDLLVLAQGCLSRGVLGAFEVREHDLRKQPADPSCKQGQPLRRARHSAKL